MMFGEPGVVPPIVLLGEVITTPTPLTPCAPNPYWVPMVLPSRTSPVAEAPVSDTPADANCPKMFPAPWAVPPMVLSADSMIRPAPSYRKVLASTRFPVADAPEIDIPATVSSERSFPAPLAVPPIELPGASTITPTFSLSRTLPIKRFAVADAPEIETPAVVLSSIKFPASPIPPIVLPGALRITPTGFARSSPTASVPMKLPSRTFPDSAAPEIEMPAIVLRPIMFPAPISSRRSCCSRIR